MKKIIVIGAGISGLATASLLARDGHEVTVLEKNNQPGGRAGVLEKNGYRFDPGPSWLMMPDIFEKYFSEFKVDMDDLMDLKKLEPSYRAFFAPDDFQDIFSDLEKNKNFFEQRQPGSYDLLKKFVTAGEGKYKRALRSYFYGPSDNITDFLSPDLPSDILFFAKQKIWQSYDQNVRQYFSDERLYKILSWHTVFLGGSPKSLPSLYTMMDYVDFVGGTFYPKQGIHGLIQAMVKVATNQGVKIIYNQPVNKINIINERNKQLVTSQEKYQAEIVVNSADYHHVETKLLDKEYQSYPEEYWSKKEIAPSALQIHLGINKKLKNIKHHNYFFTGDWDRHFQQIFNKPTWPDNPLYYVCNPSQTSDQIAPPGHEVLTFLVPVAAGLSDDEETRQQQARQVISMFERDTKQSITNNITVKLITSHRDQKKLFNAYKGTGYGLSHITSQTAVFRPKKKNKKIPNFYHTGQYTHPGIGMPPVIASAYGTYATIKRDLQ